MINIVDDTFDKIIAKGTVLVDFWASWCGPCQEQGTVLDAIEGDYPNVTFAKASLDDNMTKGRKYKIVSIPTLMLFKDGEPIRISKGLHDAGRLSDLLNYQPS